MINSSLFCSRDSLIRRFVSTITRSWQWLDLCCFKASNDCALRSLSKNEPEDFEGDVSDEELKLKNAEEADEQLGTDTVISEDRNTARSDNAKVDGQVTETSLKGKGEYVRDKAKNIAELKRELDKVKEQYPLPDELKKKPMVKKSAKGKGKMQGNEVIRRESLHSNQPKWVLLWPLWRYTHTSLLSSSIIPTVPVPTSTSAPVESLNGAEELTKSAPIPQVTIFADNEDSQNSTGPTSQELPASPVHPLDEVQAIEIAPLTIDSAFKLVTNSLTPVNSDSAIDSITSAPVDLEPTKLHSHSHSPGTLDSIGDSSSSGAPGDQSTESVQSTAGNGGNGDTDMIMADDTNLPVYLIGMIGYLHGVAADRAWQDLVTCFVTFEKTGRPTNGVSAV